MSWTDSLSGSLGNLLGQAGQGAVPAIIRKALGEEGVQSILAKLQDGGMAEHVRSWLDENRKNLPISPEQLQAALGSQQVRDIAKSLGLPIDKLLSLLSEHLPDAAGEPATPDSQPTDDSTQ